MSFLRTQSSDVFHRRISIILFTILLVSCTREKAQILPNLPATPILTTETSWGVVHRAYERIFVEKNPFSELNGILRLGDIIQVVSRESLEGEYWIKIRISDSSITGWVPEKNLDIYDSLERARTAQKSITATLQ